MPNRKRNIPIFLWVTEDEKNLILKKMELMEITNMSAYLRKMAIDGYTIQLNVPELKELVSLLRYSSNNLNQLTKRVHETGRVYDKDLEDLNRKLDQLWQSADTIIRSLSKL